MRALLLAILIVTVVMLTGCLVRSSGRHGEVYVVPPPLPSVVVIEDEPYYYQSGYHYHYRNDGWFYSQSRQGPWKRLPRDRYPKETRFKHKDRDRGHDRGRDRDHDRDHDRDRDRDRH